jgi:hypothetical protein
MGFSLCQLRDVTMRELTPFNRRSSGKRDTAERRHEGGGLW